MTWNIISWGCVCLALMLISLSRYLKILKTKSPRSKVFISSSPTNETFSLKGGSLSSKTIYFISSDWMFFFWMRAKGCPLFYIQTIFKLWNLNMQFIQIKHSTIRMCFAIFLFITPNVRRTNRSPGFRGGIWKAGWWQAILYRDVCLLAFSLIFWCHL